MQFDQQLYQISTLHITIPGEDGPHGGASLAEAGLHGMFDLVVLMTKHAQVGEGLAALSDFGQPPSRRNHGACSMLA